MLLIKIVSPSGAIDPVILEQAENITVYDALSSPDEGISFEIAKNAPKADVLNPTVAYLYYWEVYDTAKNERINYGPITTVAEDGPNWKVTGAGRSALLNDIKSTNKTFYGAIDNFVDNLRYENIATAPRASTIVWSGELEDAQNIHEHAAFDEPEFDDTFHSLSKATKDYAIDNEAGYIAPGKIEPSRGFYVAKQYWSGTTTQDSLIVDLGNEYPISKIKLLFPWWGGKARINDRTYDFDLAYTNAVDPFTFETSADWEYWRKPIHKDEFTTLYSTGTNNHLVTFPETPMVFNLGTTNSGIGYAFNQFNVATNQSGPINLRFIRVAIKDVHAWYGSDFDAKVSHDGYDYQCDPSYVTASDPYFPFQRGVMRNAVFNDTVLESASDCHASVVELGAFKEIVGKSRIKPLAFQKIDSNNLQIIYAHTPTSAETRSVVSDGVHFRRFEPGTFFRKFTVTYSASSLTYTKFFKSDCANCYPDGFHFGIHDSNQNMIYASDNSSGTNVAVRSSIYTRYALMKGSANAYVSQVDAWRGQSDPLSYGGSYAYSKTTNDTAIIHFRGESFRWFATVPEGQTGAQVKIEIRHKLTNVELAGSGNTGNVVWSSWTTLENNYQLPTDIHAEMVYEIPYGSAILDSDTVYEIKITNQDGNYASIDSIEGYWSGSYTTYNEDNSRIKVLDESAFKQIYNKRFSGGSMYKWNKPGRGVTVEFEGDRIVVLSAKGRNHGVLNILLRKRSNLSGLYDIGDDDHVFIPGGDPTSGILTRDLDTGKRGNESAQHVIFDSNDYFTNGLPWDKYTLTVFLGSIAAVYTTTKNEVNSDNFKYRCRACIADASGSVVTTKFVYLDGIGIHEKTGLSVSFENEYNLKQLQDVAEAVQVEWDVTDDGLIFEPRVGTDTEVVLRESSNTLVDFSIVSDAAQVATTLYSAGADIDGLPLSTVTEDFKTLELMGRTVMRDHDFREIADYQQLVGLSRGELRRRRTPQERITVTHIGDLDFIPGDTFNLVTKKRGEMRVRILKQEITQNTGGIVYSMECSKWPVII